MDSPAQGDTLSTREVAAALGVAERTVYYYVEQGLIEAQETRKGRVRRLAFTRDAVAACRERIQAK